MRPPKCASAKTALIISVVSFVVLSYQGRDAAADSFPGLFAAKGEILVRLARIHFRSDRTRLLQVMDRAARQAGVDIDPKTMVIGSQERVSLVNAAIRGFEGIGLEDFENGADVGFVFFDGPPTRDAPALVPGFYTVRVIKTFDGDFRGIFVNSRGREVAAVPVQVTTTVIEPGPVGVEVLKAKSTVCLETLLALGWNVVKVDAGLVAYDAFRVGLGLAAPSPGPLEDKYCGEGSGPGGSVVCDDAFINSCKEGGGTYHPPGELGEHHTWGTCIEPTG